MDPIIEALVTGASDDTIMEMLAEKEKEEGVEELEEKEKKEEDQPPKYRSCIKVRGRPILPPVMTEEVRRECQEWKRRALEVEERLAQERRVTIMEKVDRIVTRAMAAGHKVDDEVQVDESLKLESGELSEEDTDREDESLLGYSVEYKEDGEDEESSSLQSVMRANSRLGEEVLTGRTEEETLTKKEEETLTQKEEDTLAQEEEVTYNEGQEGFSEGEVTEEISEELTEEISEDTDEEDISEDILEENQVEEENEGQENCEKLLEETRIENSETDKEHGQEFAKEKYNTEEFKDSATDQELIFVEHTEEIKTVLPEKSEDKQVPLSSRSQISESYSGPKSFEEIKKLVKSLPATPSLPVSLETDKMVKDYEDDASSFISDDDDDETCAPSITTEVYEEWRYNLVGQQQELNRRPGITDSLLSVTTVVENPIFGRKATLKEREDKTTEKEGVNEKEDHDDKEKSRPRRGSYSLDQPSPLLAAHMARFGTVGEADRRKEESDQINNVKAASKSTGESLSTGRLANGISQPESFAKDSQKSGSMLDDPRQNKRELLQRYLESLASQPPSISKPPSPNGRSLVSQPANIPKPSMPISQRPALSSAELLKPSSPGGPSQSSEKHNPSSPGSERQTSAPPKRQGSISRHVASVSITSQASPQADLKHRRQQSRQSLALTPQKLTPNSKTSSSYRTPVPSPFSASRKLSRSPNPQTPDWSLNGPKWPTNHNPSVPGLELAGLVGDEESSQSLAPSSSVTLPTSSSTYRASTRNSEPEDAMILEEKVHGGSRRIPEPEDLQQAVSSLALAQQASLQHLLARQEEERRAMRQEFEARQRELVAEILQQFPGLNLSTTDNGKENVPPVARNLEDSFRNPSSRTTNPSTLEPSRASSSSSTLKDDPPIKTVMRSNTFKVTKAKKEEKVVIKLPSAALAPLHLAAWTRLTALARGFLTRRLMATERVQDLKRTIRETLSCAVQLHMEAGGAPNKQELDLHARLLAQLEAACADVHYIFFDLTVGERMVLLANDRAARQAKAQRLLDARKEEADKVKPRLSSATAARIAAKSKAPSPALARFESRRRRAVLNSRPTALRTSPRNRVVRSIYSAPGPRSSSSSMMTKSTGSLKPGWK